MSKLHLKQPGFTSSVCGPFTKHRERIQNFREAGNLKHLYRNELDKVSCAHDTAYSGSKDLAKRTISDMILKYRTYKISRTRGYDEYQEALASKVYKLFDKKTGSGAVETSRAEVSVNEQLAEELHKPVIKKFKKRKVYARFKNNIWTADLAEILNIYYVS